MATKQDLEAWVTETLDALAGRATAVEVATHTWEQHEQELRDLGDLLYTWQYDARWAAQTATRPPAPALLARLFLVLVLEYPHALHPLRYCDCGCGETGDRRDGLLQPCQGGQYLPRAARQVLRHDKPRRHKHWHHKRRRVEDLPSPEASQRVGGLVPVRTSPS